MPHDADNIVKKLDKQWNMYTVQLYPEWKHTDNEGFMYGGGWSLGKRSAVIQLPLKILHTSYICHEHAHGVVECYRDFIFSGKKLNDYGHGPLWAGVFALNLSIILGNKLVDIVRLLRYHGLCVLNEKNILEFKTIFVNS